MLDPLVRIVKKRLWARPPLLAPVPSQAIYSSPHIAVGSRRVKIVRNLHTCFDSLVIRNINDERITQNKLVFRSVTVWEPGTGGQDVETQCLTRHFPHDEMDTVPNSQVRQRTVVASGALSAAEGAAFLLHWSRLWLWAAAPHGDRELHRLRKWTSSTRHGDSDPHKKLSQFVGHCSSGGEAAGRRT